MVSRNLRRKKLESKESITSDGKIVRPVRRSRKLPIKKKPGTSETETRGNILTKEHKESKSFYHIDSYKSESSGYGFLRYPAFSKSHENLKKIRHNHQKKNHGKSSISQS